MSDKLTMVVDLKAQIGQFNASMEQAKKKLVDAFSGKGIKNYSEELNKIGRIFDKLSLTTANPIDSKTTFGQMQKELTEADQRLNRLLDDLENLKRMSFTQRLSFLPDNFEQDLKKGKIALDGFYKTISAINNSKLNTEEYGQIQKTITEYNKKLEERKKLEEEIGSLQLTKKTSEENKKQISEQLELNKQHKEQLEAFKQRNELEKAYKELTKNTTFTEEEIKQAAANGSSSIEQIVSKYPKKIADQITAAADASKGSIFSEASKKRTKSRQPKAEEIPVVSNITQKEAKENLEAIAKAYNELIVAQERFKQLGGIEENLKNDTTAIEDLNATINKESQDIKALGDVSETADINIIKKQQALNALNTTLNTNAKNFEEATKRQKELDAEFASTQKTKIAEAYTKLDEALKNCGLSLEQFGNIEEMDSREAQRLLQSLYDTNVVTPELDAAIQQITGAFNAMGEAANGTAQAVDKNSESFDKLTERAQNIDQLTNRIKYFTGFAGVINLARKSLRDAVQTITELDKAMTQMAVVTKATVSDYWEQLPKYTERANKLGATIRDMYEADTLYYQQGLKTNQVMQVANETMKMARIAGLGAAEATDRMTNALRGFNMAINEESAERINDVYSKLAAITASNVDEISTAMTKTASIAHSAGMEFETTAAFLSQIIETTRESAETAGTALKTVIARFQELKKKPSEIGEVEGEIVDANKIEGALRTVGIALRDSEGQFRKLDDVFIELAGKWGELDKNTQRYIATIAAGSRQQSRFVALMQDYSHTVELVDAAYNSAGTSQKQYEKTLDSLQTKFNAFKNAWDTFTMSLFDNHIVKTAVDFGKTILNTLNQVLDKFDVLNLGIPKIALVIAGVNKLGIAYKVFAKELSQENGTIISSFAAVGASIKGAFNTGLIKDTKAYKISFKELAEVQEDLIGSSQAMTMATEAEKEAVQEATVAYQAKIKAEQNLAKATRKNRQAYTNILKGRTEGYNEALENVKPELRGQVGGDARAAERLAAANMKLAASYNLSSESQTRFLKMLNGTGTQMKSNYDLTLMSTIATNEEAAAEANLIIEKEGVITTEQLETVVKKYKLSIIYKSIVAQKLEALSQSKLLKIITLGTSARWLHAAAMAAEHKQYVKMIGDIALTTAALGAVIALVVIIVKLVQKILSMRLSERIKAAQENLDNATESLKDCKDALADLEDEQDKYKSLHEELQKNIQGTKEWKQKLIEVNEQVYDLIQKYPTLASYVQRTSSGEMIVSEEGWDTVLQQQQNKIQSSKMTQYSAQRELFELQEEALRKDLKRQIKKITGEYYSNGSLDWSSPDSVMSSLGIKIQEEPELYKALNDYKVAVEKNTSALGVMAKSFSDYVEREDKDNLTPTQLKGMDTLFENMGVIGPFTYDLGLNTYISTKGSANIGEDYKDSSTFKRLAKEYGVWDAITGNDVEALKTLARKIFPEMSETDIAERVGKARDFSKHGQFYREMVDEANRQWAEKNAANLSASDLEVVGLINDVASLTVKKAKGIDNKEIGSKEVQTIVNDILTEEQTSMYRLWREGFNDIIKDFADLQSWQITKSNTNEIEDPFEREMVKALWALSDDFNLGELKSIEGLLMREVAGTGKADIDSILKYAQMENGEILKELLTFDTSSLEELEKARDLLIDKWPLLTDDINKMIDEIAKAGGAVNRLDFQTLIDKTKALSGELAKINNYEQGASFTEEQRKLFIDNGMAKEEDFVLGSDGNYVYLKPIQDLKDAILANTKALEEEQQSLDNQFNLAEKYREFQSGQKEGKYKNQNIDDFIKNNWESIVALKIPGITENTNYNSIGKQLQQKIRDEVENLGKEMTQGTYQATKNSYIEALAMSKSSSGTAATNLADLLGTKNISELDKEALQKAGILNIQEGEEGYDALIQKLNTLRKAVGEDSTEYKDFLKTLSNKKDITAAQKGIKNLISSSQTFVENYEKAGNNAELKMAEVLDQAKQFSLDGTKITAENYEAYAQLFDQFSEGNYEAYQMIAELLLEQQGLTQKQIAEFWAGNLEITTDSLKKIATLAQTFGLGFTEIIGDKAFLKGWKDLSGFASASGKGSSNPWEDPYNWLWNINKRINKEIFERERLERKYEKAVEDTAKTEQDLYNISKKELENLERQAQLERDKGTKAMQEAQMMMKQRADFAKYVSWDTTNGQIQVDYSSIDKLGWNSDRGSAFEDFVGRLEELIDEVQDSQTTLEEIEDLTEDIKNRGRDQYLELQDRIKNALVEINQREIDTREKINESIKTAQDELLNKIQEEISETRQIRSNQEKEQELEDKRQRLNYLRRDTTGANAVQIKKLEEELQKGEQSYTDSLTDQTLQNIQKANQKAEEQRAEEIEIMNNQLTRWQETGAIWETVDASINEGFDNPENFLNSQVGALLATAENKRALSELQQADWDKDLENQAKLAELFNNGQLYQQGEQTLESVRTCQNELYKVADNTGQIGDLNQSLAQLLEVYPKDYSDKVSSSATGIGNIYKSLQELIEAITGKKQGIFSTIGNSVMGIFNVVDNIKLNFAKLLAKMSISAVGTAVTNVKDSFGKLFPFAEGGLATQTGIAQLDGTPVKPEYVLNADQTKAFFDLVNTITSNDGKTNGIGGDNYFDIDINVDELSNDYDVENVAEKIKQMIWEDSQYRNVNLVSLLR